MSWTKEANRAADLEQLGTKVPGLARRSPSERSMTGESRDEGGSNSVVESQPSKLLVAGSIPVSRSNLRSPRELRAASYGWQANLRLTEREADLSAVAPSAKSAARRPM